MPRRMQICTDPRGSPVHAVLSLFRDDIPAVVQWLRPHIFWATALFILTVLAGYWMVHTYPDLIALFASPELIATVERGQLWTEGLLNVVPSSVLSLQILTHNIVVSLFAYCAGFLFGLGHGVHPGLERAHAGRGVRIYRAVTGWMTPCFSSCGGNNGCGWKFP